VDRAVALAENNGAELTLVSVLKPAGTGMMFFKEKQAAELETRLREDHMSCLTSLADPHRQRIKIGTKVLSGVPFLEIIYEVLRHGRDLVMKTPANPDWIDDLFGSDDMHLLRKCPCPVWMVKADASQAYTNILASVDVDAAEETEASQASQNAMNFQILQMAASLSVSEASQLHVVHVWDALAESLMHSALVNIPEKEIAEYVRTAQQMQRSKLNRLLRDVEATESGAMLRHIIPRLHLIRGVPSKAIPELARKEHIELVVMGTVGRTGIPGFIMGNTAETILHQMHCSVLAIKPPGFQSPVTLEA
jgi:nucleotide-binding universal stress UspA family protein